jgi:hypothetical protein
MSDELLLQRQKTETKNRDTNKCSVSHPRSWFVVRNTVRFEEKPKFIPKKRCGEHLLVALRERDQSCDQLRVRLHDDNALHGRLASWNRDVGHV